MAKPGRPRKITSPPEDDDLIGSITEEPPAFNVDVVWGGVTASWLQQVFGGDRNVVKKKLAEGQCKPIGMKQGAPTYSLKEAAACLVAPKFNVEETLQKMRYNDLPPMLQAAYWDGKLKRQQFEKLAGDLWHTADVQEVLGDVFFHFATTVKLWGEEVEREIRLSPEQRTLLLSLSDKLLESTNQMLREAPGRKQTPSSIVDEDEEENVDAV